MTHNHVFSDKLFSRLQSHAVPLVDSIDDVISKALDALEQAVQANTTHQVSDQRFSPTAMPNLTFTTVRAAAVNGVDLSKADWNMLLREVIRQAGKSGASSHAILKNLTIPTKLGAHTGTGYKFIQEAGLSIQGQNSNNAWKQIYLTASQFGISVDVTWSWQDNDKAHLPNVTGTSHIPSAS